MSSSPSDPSHSPRRSAPIQRPGELSVPGHTETGELGIGSPHFGDGAAGCGGDDPATGRGHLIDILTLALVPGVGPILLQRLLDRWGGPTEILAARRDELERVPGLGPKLAARIVSGRSRSVAEACWERCGRLQIALVSSLDRSYPNLLREIPDPPQVLQVAGRLTRSDELAVAVVGTRRPSRYGMAMARRLATDLARAGVTIVSGLARGIDRVAHEAALVAGGRTVAVLATGVETIYPPEHQGLAAAIRAEGALVAEIAAWEGSRRAAFPRRNRIISGLTAGVVVVEAALRSGALITARHANEQGREVFAVPGRADQHVAAGCLDLLRAGATLVTTADHVLEGLGPLYQPVTTSGGDVVVSPRELQLNSQETEVIQHLSGQAILVDELIRRANLPAGRVMATLSVLETKQLVVREEGARVRRA